MWCKSVEYGARAPGVVEDVGELAVGTVEDL